MTTTFTTNYHPATSPAESEWTNLKLQLAAAEADRDSAQALVGDIRAIISRPGRKLEAVTAKLITYDGDYELRSRRLRARP